MSSPEVLVPGHSYSNEPTSSWPGPSMFCWPLFKLYGKPEIIEVAAHLPGCGMKRMDEKSSLT